MLALVWRSKNVSGRRNVCKTPLTLGIVTFLGRGIDKGHSQCPRSLFVEAPSEGEGTLGISIDFAHIGDDWLRKVYESDGLAPVMMRPVTTAVIECMESPRSALISRDPLILSFSKKVGRDLADFAPL